MKSPKDDLKRYLANWQGEKEAVYLYTRFAESEANPNLAAIYRKLAETEVRHVEAWEARILAAGASLPRFRPRAAVRLKAWLAGRLGTAAMVDSVAAVEKDAASEYDGQPEAEAYGMSKEERSHARVFGYLSRAGKGMGGEDLARFEGRHKAGGGNALRAAVLGANDGLVSVFSLVMGVAGAGASRNTILVTGGAGLLAGALSMALGEWLSVQSSRELYQNQIGIEEAELAELPEEEKAELALIYQAKGLDRASAEALADRLLSDKATALETLAREELHIDPSELGGSAWEAAATSFFLFAGGALIPTVPYLFWSGMQGVLASTVFSTLGLFGIGAAITLLTGRKVLFSGLRQVLFGVAAAAISYGIGALIGVSLN
jgi:VIT1/CCC1 family predicted Fe2+/Mn2+ transporter/rubrerythrin